MRIDTLDPPSIEEGRVTGQIFPGTAVESDEMPDWWGDTSSTNDTPGSITLADIEQAFERASSRDVSGVMEMVDQAREQAREYHERLVADAQVSEQIHQFGEAFGVTEAEILAVFDETGDCDVRLLAEIARQRQSSPESSRSHGVMRGVFTEREVGVSTDDETKPFTDDDFDRLIADIEGLTNDPS